MAKALGIYLAKLSGGQGERFPFPWKVSSQFPGRSLYLLPGGHAVAGWPRQAAIMQRAPTNVRKGRLKEAKDDRKICEEGEGSLPALARGGFHSWRQGIGLLL